MIAVYREITRPQKNRFLLVSFFALKGLCHDEIFAIESQCRFVFEISFFLICAVLHKLLG